MKRNPLLLAGGWILITSLLVHAQQPDALSLSAWKSGPLPFSFKYDGKDSDQILPTWQRSEETAPSEGGETHRYIFSDPVTKLKVTAEVRTFHDYPAIDWVLHFTNESTVDTPIIEDVQPLRWSAPVQDHRPILHWAFGSSAGPNDFQPQDSSLSPGQKVVLRSNGRSSSGTLPFFNLQDGNHGMIGAIGWTGNWMASFNAAADGKTATLDAGMPKTHFLLHGGETVRTPRIVFLDWHGNRDDSQNLWRRFVLGYYSPRDTKGQVVTVPLSFGSWGAEAIATKLANIQMLHDKQIAIDTYWVDAGWYGNDPNWSKQRGSWVPFSKFYPQGFKPLGDALKADGYGFILWLEPETADPGSTFLTEHPDWYIVRDPGQPALLNLGNPEARQGMTDFLSNLITTAGMTWYRQDFNIDPYAYWAAKDTPDRIGITEIADITGLYKFWDDLRTAHPGLQIDNCASGGRRLDIETISRSVSLWRSDFACNPRDPFYDQMLTQALAGWVPLNAGVYGSFPAFPQNLVNGEGTPLNPGQIYAVRSGYSAGWTIGSNGLPLDILKPAAKEFDQVRPFFQGDFYPLIPYSSDPSVWTAWQLHRPDLKSGVVIALRRQASPYISMHPALHAIEPAARYDVEIRSGMEKGTVREMSGQELVDLQITVPDQPGSVLIFYTRH